MAVVALMFGAQWALATTMPLGPGPVVIEAEDAVVAVEIADAARSLVEVPQVAEERVTVKTSGEETRVVVARGPGGPDRRVALRVVLNRSQALEIAGASLDVSIEDRAAAAAEGRRPGGVAAAEAAEGNRVPLVRVRLSRSTLRARSLDLAGRSFSVVAESSEVDVEACSAPLDAELSGGALRLSGHRGAARIVGRQASISLEEGATPATVQLEEGELTARNGEGNLRLTARDARLLVSQWRGPAQVDSTGGTLQVERSPGSVLDLKLADAQASLVQGSGRTTATCTRGSFELDGYGGPVVLKASDRTSVATRDTSDRLDLEVTDGASVRVADAQGPVTARVRGTPLNVERARSLLVDARGSEVDLRGIAALKPALLDDCRGEVDLREASGTLVLTVTRSTGLSLLLSDPCEVRAKGPGGELGSGIDCSGCDLRLAATPPGASRRLLGGTKRTIVALTIDEGSRLQVRGD